MNRRYRYPFIVITITCAFAVYNLYTRWLSAPAPLSNEHLHYLQEIVSHHDYSVLSLGGSVTAGANLRHHTHSYPYIVGSSPTKVTNAAIEATGGSDYPGLCLNSLVGGGDYNVILLEFSLDGHDEIELLLRRIRHRFPSAIIIYVHLYSLHTDIADNEGLSPMERGDTNIVDLKPYHWAYGERMNNAVYQNLSEILKRYSAHMYALPKTPHVADSTNLFASDRHYLSQEGHNTVAEGILSLLKDAQIPAINQKNQVSTTTTKRSREDGEECLSWYYSGKVTLTHKGSIKLVRLKTHARSWKRYALECDGDCFITIINESDSIIPLYMFFMTLSGDYPIVEVRLQGDTTIVDPTTNAEREVVSSKIVGSVAPGVNVVQINPITDAVLPFRVTGFAYCETCERFRDYD